MKTIVFRLLVIISLLSSATFAVPELLEAQAIPTKIQQLQDSVLRTKKLLEEAKVAPTHKTDLEIIIQNVSITKFPEVSLIVEVMSSTGVPPDSISPNDLFVSENGQLKRVHSVKKISTRDRVPVDFVFILDITGTMQNSINAIRANIETFVNSLVRRGIDYRLGLVLFNDYVEKNYPFTDDYHEFMKWMTNVYASGGMDEKENALEAIAEAGKNKFRPSANKVAVIITDAPFHQAGEKGLGRTTYTTDSMIEYLRQREIRLFCIAPPNLTDYKKIANATRGAVYDINLPFAKILDTYSTQLTNLYAISYRSDEPAIPDSINVAILNEKKQELVRQTIPILEIGRKLIIEALLFETNSFTLPDSVPELNTLNEFMHNRQEVTIQVEGHTDNKGSAKINKKLSEQRAEAVKDYLVKKGINEKRIKVIGYGLTRPIASNDTEFGRKLNRRTEIVIISK